MRKKMYLFCAVIAILAMLAPIYAQAQTYDRARVKYLNDRAHELHKQGRDAEALPLFQEAAVAAAKVYGPTHSITTLVLNNLGELYNSMGEYDRAEATHLLTLNIRSKTLGYDHIDTAESLNNLGRAYLGLGDYDKADDALNAALFIRVAKLGMKHPDVAETLNRASSVSLHKGDYAEAEELLSAALTIDEITIGPNHPNTVIVRENLAELRRQAVEKATAASQGPAETPRDKKSCFINSIDWE